MQLHLVYAGSMGVPVQLRGKPHISGAPSSRQAWTSSLHWPLTLCCPQRCSADGQMTAAWLASEQMLQTGAIGTANRPPVRCTTCSELTRDGFKQSTSVPTPHCPFWFLPKVYISPASVRAQVCASPHDNCTICKQGHKTSCAMSQAAVWRQLLLHHAARWSGRRYALLRGPSGSQ